MEEVSFQLCLKISQRKLGGAGEMYFELNTENLRGLQRAEEAPSGDSKALSVPGDGAAKARWDLSSKVLGTTMSPDYEKCSENLHFL